MNKPNIIKTLKEERKRQTNKERTHRYTKETKQEVLKWKKKKGEDIHNQTIEFFKIY